MKLKVKHSGWSAGRPVAIINRDSAKKLSVTLGDRILISTGDNMITATLDLSSKMAKKNQVVLSTEIIKLLNIKNDSLVNVEIAKKPRTVQIINKKLGGKKLTSKEIETIIKSIANNSLTEIEIAFFISSVYKEGMNFNETAAMTLAMVNTGKKLSLTNKTVVDKHSIGGIAGNRTTPIVVSICASAGLIFPKTSSRAITSAAGTADVMETLCRVDFTISELKRIIKKTGACLAWGGGLGFAPVDDKLIYVEKLINLDPEPNLLASILAKKLAAGSNYLLIDIPYGKSAKVTKSRAIRLKNKFKKLTKKFKIKTKVVLTNGSQPIGNGIGPTLELKDVISVLKGDGPEDLKNKAIYLSAELLELAKKAKKGQGKKIVQEILESGKALEKFYQIIKAQGADLKNIDKTLKLANFSYDIKSSKNIKIKSIDNKKINILARVLGSPSDKKAGIYLNYHVGHKLKKGETIMTLYSQSKRRLEDAKDFYKEHKIVNLK